MKNLLKTLTKDQLEKIRIQHYQAGEIIFKEDDVCHYVCVIIEGKIDIISSSISGSEILFNSLSENDVFGNNLIFSDIPLYRGDVISISDSILAFIDKPVLIYLIQNNVEFLMSYLSIQSNFGKSLNSKIKLLSFQNAEDRLMFHLKNNGSKLNFKSVTSLAKDLNIQRETLSRLLSKLIKDKIIRRKHNYIELI